MGMFCYQCQETAGNTGCTVKGVCGKDDVVARLQDVLVHVLKGIAFYATEARKKNIDTTKADQAITDGLFATVTNVNFDPDRFVTFINDAVAARSEIAAKVGVDAPAGADFDPGKTKDEMLSKADSVGVLAEDNEDIRSLKELVMYGVKGVAAYHHHARMLGGEDKDVDTFNAKALNDLLRDDIGADELVALTVETGNAAVKAMAALDAAHVNRFGNPEITEVDTGTVEGPGILVSGHDLVDLEELLIQTEGTGVNVYTHGEMLPAHAYPGLKKYKHLVGNYGTSWWNQWNEFEDFNGAVYFTTNCIQKPRDTYFDRVFTSSVVGWPGLEHIGDRKPGGMKNFMPVIDKAKSLGNVKAQAGKKLTIGFAHDQVMQLADKVVDAVKDGAIKRFVVMAGCDGRHNSRQYFTDVAQELPKDAVILTAGCAKFRYNMLDLGDIGGIPRVLDAGQCNDSYSLAVIALKLKEVFGAEDVNDLPISFDIGWYEQKAVCVLLALLALGFKSVRIGPTLPAFLSPNVASQLIEMFDLKATNGVKEDVEAIMTAK